MHLLKIAALALFPVLGTVLAAPSPRQSTSGTIVAPADGTSIAPGETFAFSYNSMADFGVSSYNYTVWLFTSVPTSFAQSVDFAQGHYFGRFAEPNFPGTKKKLITSQKGNPSPPNIAPANLTMPDFSKNPGGFGTGASESNGHFALVVMEEYATGAGSVGSRLTLAINRIVYNATKTY
ncbi:hypothetical protein B0H16DRAFT_1296935 [Mycena metata]|uniref:Uncharacterized protein n=1 Tax=Mycena metata TaxID=1033252 RepID=A0AAD7KJF9_9AGAR|nr:hypothetical protein B0H16DRAFT_1296935 [Mycena metata]